MSTGRIWRVGAVVAGGVGASLLQAMPLPQTTDVSQQAPPIVVIGPDADIVVTGPRPVMRGGLWEFHRVGPAGPRSRPFHFTTCLPDGELEAALRDLAGERSMTPRPRHCGTWRLRVAEGRITGNRSCMQPFAGIGREPQSSRMTVSGHYDTRRLAINFHSEDRFNGMERGGGPGWNPARPTSQSWRVEATRTGDCPLKRRLDQRTLEETVSRLFDPGGNDD